MPKITHPKVWASGEPQPEWSSIKRMPTRHERREQLAQRNRWLDAIAVVITSLVLFAVTLIVVWPE